MRSVFASLAGFVLVAALVAPPAIGADPSSPAPSADPGQPSAEPVTTAAPPEEPVTPIDPAAEPVTPEPPSADPVDPVEPVTTPMPATEAPASIEPATPTSSAPTPEATEVAPEAAPTEAPPETPSDPTLPPAPAFHADANVWIEAWATEGQDEYAAEGWHYSVSATGGTTSVSEAVTDDEGSTGFDIDIDGSSAVLSITETVQPTFELLDIYCFDLASEHEVGVRNDATVSFTVLPARTYGCWFANNSLLPAPARVGLYALLDADGDPDTRDDRDDAGKGWTFEAEATGNATLDDDQVTTDESSEATLKLVFAKDDDAGTVTITGVPREGFTFIEGSCYSWDDEDDEVETEVAWVDGGVTLDVVPGARLWCAVVNASTEAPVITPSPTVEPTQTDRPDPMPTPPETDAMRPVTSAPSTPWFPLVLIVTMGGVFATLVVSRPRR
ncbi:MAG TPA: hypothetical protein VFL03_15570 [Candidatus Limnocylindrales bacterium]|nr:hypothetical protein [Candidatus Limnocylindrales bacterium]